ncbi:MAG: sulfite exporter TauE/SafE family protein [Alkalispirochaeta sp.]
MTIVVGYVLAVVVGTSLGVFGAGGSILTVPILVYVVGVPPVLATAYSLLVVGVTSIVGAVAYIRRGEVNIATATVFAIPSVIAVYATRRFLVPAIPADVFAVGTFVVGRDTLIMLLFGVLMAWASIGMIRGRHASATAPLSHGSRRTVLIAAEGLTVGVLTGLVGAGGGFLIVPVLVLAAGMTMRQAVGTSLIIITLKSVVGFAGDLSAGQSIDWIFLSLFTTFAVAGIVAGTLLSTHISEAKVKPLFGWFVLVAGVVIVVTEVLQGGIA